jgi:hypothetical protein
MSKLIKWVNSLDENEPLNKLIDRLLTLTITLVVIFELSYLFIWSK